MHTGIPNNLLSEIEKDIDITVITQSNNMVTISDKINSVLFISNLILEFNKKVTNKIM